METTTWRTWLNEAGFDWASGVLVHQIPEVPDWLKDTWDSSLDEPWNRVRWHDAKIEKVDLLSEDSTILDQPFSGHGFPLIFARDARAIYMIGWGPTTAWLVPVPINPVDYLLHGSAIVTPMGGD